MQAFQSLVPPRSLYHAPGPFTIASTNAPRCGSGSRGGSAAGETGRLTGDGAPASLSSQVENSVGAGYGRLDRGRSPERHGIDKKLGGSRRQVSSRTLMQDHSISGSGTSSHGGRSGSKGNGSSSNCSSAPTFSSTPLTTAAAAKGGAIAVPWRHGTDDTAAAESGSAARERGGTKDCEEGRRRGDGRKDGEEGLEEEVARGEGQTLGGREWVTAGASVVSRASAAARTPSVTEGSCESSGRCSASGGGPEAVGRQGGEDEGGASRQHPCLRILLIDNYDSYTYNLAHLLTEVNGAPPTVIFNDQLSWPELRHLLLRSHSHSHSETQSQVHSNSASSASSPPPSSSPPPLFDAVVISPGPGTPTRPSDIGVCWSLLSDPACASVPILGVCLGHQALAAVHGGSVVRATEPVHGRLSDVQHSGHPLFEGIPSGPGFEVMRYHSLVVDPPSLPPCLTPIAWTTAVPSSASASARHKGSSASTRRPALQSAAPAAPSAAAAETATVTGGGGGGVSAVGASVPATQCNTRTAEPGYAGPPHPTAVLMALAHCDQPHFGVQFHPESVASLFGAQLIRNFIRLAARHTSTHHGLSSPLPPASSTLTSTSLTALLSSLSSPSPSHHSTETNSSTGDGMGTSNPSGSKQLGNQSMCSQQEHQQQQQQQLQLCVRCLPAVLSRIEGGSATLFTHLFGGRDKSEGSGGREGLGVGEGHEDTFWLDSAFSNEGRARFSHMGGRGGPLWQRLMYMQEEKGGGEAGQELEQQEELGHRGSEGGGGGGVATGGGVLHATDVQGNTETRNLPRGFFAFMEEEMASFHLPSSQWQHLPFDFCGGLVGVLGYELKSECLPGLPLPPPPPPSSPPPSFLPSASFFRVDRWLSVDHLTGDVFVAALAAGVGGGAEGDAEGGEGRGRVACGEREREEEEEGRMLVSVASARQSVQWVEQMARRVEELAVRGVEGDGSVNGQMQRDLSDVHSSTQAAAVAAAAAAAAAAMAATGAHAAVVGVPGELQQPKPEQATGAEAVGSAAGKAECEGSEGSSGRVRARARWQVEGRLQGVWGSQDYGAAVRACQEAIRAGEAYELCLTQQLRGRSIPEDRLAAYLQLRDHNPAPYAAWMHFEGWRGRRERGGNSWRVDGVKNGREEEGGREGGGGVVVCCCSPERLLRGDRWGGMEAKPIKGTRARGRSKEEDEANRMELQESEKDRAENLMIVDLLRNDLSRVSLPASVHVPHLLAIESFSSVHQLVSTVRSQRSTLVSPSAALRAVFPPGSMTGAPKLRSCALLQEIEASVGPRGLYSGALGFLSFASPAFDFNVVIRSAVILEGWGTSVGAGGAVVVQSEAQQEYEEMSLKARALLQVLEGEEGGEGEGEGGDGEKWT